MQMPDQRYEAHRQTIGSLLSTTSPHIEVPAWQRSYSWTTEAIEAFWQDLVAFDAIYPGDNITGEEYFLGSIVIVTGSAKNLILDGQQRLATATILLAALRDGRRGYNSDAAVRLQNKYISDFNDATSQTAYNLTLNIYDREFFRTTIQDAATSGSVPQATLKSHGLIRKAFEYFKERVTAQAEEAGGGEAGFKRNLRLSQVLCDNMSVVVVSTTDEDNAASVFETLNDRGIGLSTTDLLRNLLLRRAPDTTTRERIVESWQVVLSMNDDASVEEFLRHYWVSNRGDVKARKLYREIKGKILAENIDSLTFSKDLENSSLTYRDIVKARETDPILRRHLESIAALNAKALYPVLLAGYAVTDRENPIDDLRSLANALLTMFVRYNVIGGRETTVMESVLYKTAADLRESKDFNKAIASLAAISPSAEEFVARFTKVSVPRIATARYLLAEIEYAMRKTKELDVGGSDRVHLEHIYPQTPSGAKWTNHNTAINRLGNHTLLGSRLNTSIKNADFPTKREKGYAKSDFALTKELLEVEDWDFAAIEERQRRLGQYVFDIWHFPGEEPPKPEALSSSLGAEAGVVENAPDQLPEVPE